MRKVVLGLLVYIFSMSCFIGISDLATAQSESTSSGGSVLDDQQAQQAVDELSTALAAAQQELASKGISFATIKKITDITNKLSEAISNDSVDKCNAVYNSSQKRLDNAISLIEKKGCPQSERIMYRGMCAKFLNDPIKFQQCEAKEHGKKPKKPHSMMLISEDLMYRGMCAKFLNDPVKFQQCEAKEHGGSMAHGGSMIDPICFLVMCDAMGKPPTASNKPGCISQDSLDLILPKLQDASGTLKALGQNDKNTNGIPDFCDNNTK